ncbi:1-acyl-sn-glycerol-3-phosphate acyltransferase [Parabacteroides sp. PFB2-12]|uniref:1-acyl-sn-glycerol-3-phosphate acyltransferase n=1 Tax=unclassified Parabacteroides TaxID=2649774 RepID=UPI0024769375|nr:MULTISPECIES: 1-acyl-sn-glycerol-3-phosphate acyltransferase [unclassified Parabacteroides]MDH6341680.1 1-acyl-sn-glycerol-3-phosphate acyltransferase [Parabacteroides sp. PM6-13]MDH6389897.1 1-acyl-sn-glycerol-3-phosphate acyltransferase [Parabacteroides sp. PFB2-12]
MQQQETTKYIDVEDILEKKAPKLASKVPRFLVNYLKRIVHQDEVNHVISKYHDKDGVDFMIELIDYFDLHFDLVGEENIPAEGRCIFASNHPLGGMDGICLSALLGERYGGAIRYPVNDLLYFIPNLRSIFVPVNKHGKQSKETAKMTEEAYASDNQIITFPAGLCSRKIKGQIVDLDWKKSFIQKAVEYQRDIVPVYFSGRNSNFFYNLAKIRTSLGIKVNIEMLYLSDELFRSKHSRYTVYFGKPIPWQTFDNSKKPVEWAAWVKELSYRLKK